MENNKINLVKRTLVKKKGFTLVELMVVLAVIATMTFIAVPNFTSVKASVNEKVDKQSCEAIKRIVTTFIADDTIDPSKVTTLTYNAKSKAVSGTDSSVIKDALSDVKPPRTDSERSYEISINKDTTTESTSIGNNVAVSVMVSGNSNTKTE